jgi:DNA-binding response OmpR family regulator
MTEKILVVDDDLDSLKLIGLMLQRNGYEVLVANTGAQALAKASSDHPDLIILDVMMPDMNGYEVCRRLRMNAQTKTTPIIMFTAKTLIDDKVAGFEAGADDYLTKPTHPSELTSRVKAILSRNTQRRAEASTGNLIGIVGVKGGVGTTTLTLNMAASRVLAGNNVLVADFVLGSGTMALSLGLNHTQTMSTVLNKPLSEIRPKTLEDEIVQHTSGVRGLFSSPNPRESLQLFSSESALATIRALRHLSETVFLDLGSGYSQLTHDLQSELDQLILVGEPNPIAVHLTRALLDEVNLKPAIGGTERVHVVMVSRSQSANITWADAEKTLKQPIRAIVSSGSELIAQAFQAKIPPVVMQPSAIFSTQIAKLAEDLVSQASTLSRGELVS